MMGTALAWPLADNGHTVRLVGTPLDRDIIDSIQKDQIHPRLQRPVPVGVTAYHVSQLPEALDGTDFIASGVSSFGVNWFAEVVGSQLKPGVPVIAVTKGLEDQPDGDLIILPEVISQRLPAALQGKISLNAIAGPCIAHELAARRQTGVVFCGKDEAVLTVLKNLFGTSYYHIWTSNHLVGVEVCAALKNAYAMGVGLAVGMMEAAGPDGVAAMYNPQAALFAQSCLEMRRMLKLLGGDPEEVSWLPGAGDLYVTVFGGRTVRLGKLLGQGVSFAEARRRMAGETLESVEIITRVARALPRLESRGLARQVDFPLLLHMNEMINHGKTVNIPWESFFNR
jgi:glycerol-3-phosphate dehydrogenase (NAD(P)+)